MAWNTAMSCQTYRMSAMVKRNIEPETPRLHSNIIVVIASHATGGVDSKAL